MRQVKDVALHGPTMGVSRLTVIVLEKNTPRTEIWRALNGATTFMRSVGKITVAVDEDVNPNNVRVKCCGPSPTAPDLMKSVKIDDYQANGHAPKLRDREWEAKIMIDATMHYPAAGGPADQGYHGGSPRAVGQGRTAAGHPALEVVRHNLGDWCDEWTKCRARRGR